MAKLCMRAKPTLRFGSRRNSVATLLHPFLVTLPPDVSTRVGPIGILHPQPQVQTRAKMANDDFDPSQSSTWMNGARLFRCAIWSLAP